MGEKKRNIIITLETMIDDHDQIEENSLRHQGELFIREQGDVLKFVEETEHGQIHNFFTIKEDTASIKRSGIVRMYQQFKKDAITENVYHHPHGTIHMETRTKQLTYEKDRLCCAGKLVISYGVKLNGQDERKHELTLTYKEEDHKQ